MSEREQAEREKRAQARRAWPVRAFPLGSEPGEISTEGTTAAERVQMIWPLTVETWSLSGRPIPDYPREQTPVRIVRSTPLPKGGNQTES